MAHYVKKNGVLTPLNGRSAQDYLEAKGRIVVDISTQQVGDVIRVRSLLDPTQVWNREITAAGDYMVFDVPCKDIYAICLVQDVDGTPTEVTVKKKSIDYGQTLLTDVEDSDDFIIFNDGGFAANISEVTIPYKAGMGVSKNEQLVGNNLCFYGHNGNTGEGVYLTVDLTKHLGKLLCFEQRYGGGTWITKGFMITAQARRIVYGAGCPYGSSQWENSTAFGISYLDVPEAAEASDTNEIVSRYGPSPTNPILEIRKIWITT